VHPGALRPCAQACPGRCRGNRLEGQVRTASEHGPEPDRLVQSAVLERARRATGPGHCLAGEAACEHCSNEDRDC